MPNRRLAYNVDVDSSSAVRDLRRLGTEGARAGRELADGFDDAESAGTKALAALSAKLDGLQSDVEGTARAVRAVGAQLGDGFDSSQVERFVGDLNRMGVTFDEIEAKAREFADVIKRTDDIKLDATNQGLTSLGTNLDKVHDSGDQSRSVLANLAGNAAQDVGELGGVVGSLGVGLGQLVEYAVDGNISLSNLAKVAGPMLALTGALALVSNAASENQREAEEAAERMNTFREAIEELGPTAEAAAQGLEDMFDTETTAKQADLLENVVDALGGIGEAVGGIFSANQASGNDPIAILADAGYTLEMVAAAMAGGEDAWNRFMDTISGDDRLNGWGIDFEKILNDGFVAFQAGADRAAARSTFFTSSIDGVNDALRTNAGVVNDTSMWWNNLLVDMADGVITTDLAKNAWNALREELGLTDTEMAEMAQQKLDEKLQADADAADELAEAMGEARQAIADIAAESLDLSGELSRVFDVGDTVVDFQAVKGKTDDAIAELQAYIDEHGAIDWTALLDTSQIDPSAIDADMIGVVTGVRDSVQEGLIAAFDLGGTGAAAHFLETFAARLEADGIMTTSELYALLGLGPDGSIDAALQPYIDQTRADQARRILDALANVEGLPGGARVARIQVAVETGELAGEMAGIVAQIAAYEAGVGVYPVVDETTTTEEIAAAQAWLDEHPVTINAATDAEQVADAYDDAARDRTTDVDADSNAGEVGGDLDDASRDRDATINADLKQQLIQGLIVSAYLDWAARPRTAPIDAAVYGAQFAAAVLNAVATPRIAPIAVDLPNYWGAEAMLDWLARTRYARIVSTRSGFSAGGGGLAPTPVAGVDGVDGEVEAMASDAGVAVGGMALAAVAAPASPVENHYHLSLTAGVIGSRYEVSRAVRQVLADADRLGGRR